MNAFDKKQMHFPPDTTDTLKPDPICIPRFCLMQPVITVNSGKRAYTTLVKTLKSTKLILQFIEASDGKCLFPFDHISPLGNTGSYK